MFPDAVIDAGGPGWFEKEKSHWKEFAAGYVANAAEAARRSEDFVIFGGAPEISTSN